MIPTYELDMQQGADWDPIIHWYGGGVFRAPIEEIYPGYPTKIRVTSHLLPTVSDTPVIISGVEGGNGLSILNSKDTAIEMVEYVDANHFNVPISTVACEWTEGTGEITYNRPSVITNYTARCQLRTKWHSGSKIIDLTTENGGLTLRENDAAVLFSVNAAATAGLNFTTGYGEIEMISPAGYVSRMVNLIVKFHREHTK